MFSISWTNVRESVPNFIHVKELLYGLEDHPSHCAGSPALLCVAALNLHLRPQSLAGRQCEKIEKQ